MDFALPVSFVLESLCREKIHVLGSSSAKVLATNDGIGAKSASDQARVNVLRRAKAKRADIKGSEDVGISVQE